MANQYSTSAGLGIQSSVSINDSRRLFNFGERIAELAPQQSPFFTYLSKVSKKSTDDPVFKFLEQRHQWQRRNFDVVDDVTDATYALGDAMSIAVDCGYDKYGRVAAGQQPLFFVPGQVIAIQSKDDGVLRFKITSVDLTSSGEANLVVSALAAGTYEFEEDAKGQVIGSAWAEGSIDPEGWADKLYDREGYVQIFKTAIPLYSGTALATKYRGKANEYKRVWQEKLMEHKMDLEEAFLMGIGSADVDEESSTDGPIRYTWGILPYTEQYGKIYNFTYASSGYDAFLDAMEDFFAPESGNSGNKLVLCSRKILSYLNKMGSGSFMNNTVGASQYRLDVTSIPGKFGHDVTIVDTIFGKLHFVADPLLRGMWEDYAMAVDMKNVAYRPLVGNGVSRDTHIITNVQENNRDGRKDMILTEAGLEISLPETHAILKFS
jgi:hypothetical protein